MSIAAQSIKLNMRFRFMIGFLRFVVFLLI